jgi:hypothetical protein
MLEHALEVFNAFGVSAHLSGPFGGRNCVVCQTLEVSKVARFRIIARDLRAIRVAPGA